jgi:hypothetical protein
MIRNATGWTPVSATTSGPFCSSRLGALNSTPQLLLAIGAAPRRGAQLRPGDLPMEAAV